MDALAHFASKTLRESLVGSMDKNMAKAPGAAVNRKMMHVVYLFVVEMQNAKCNMQHATCKMQNAKRSFECTRQSTKQKQNCRTQ